MPIKGVVDSLEAVPEALRAEYAPINDGPLKGKFSLQVEGMVEKARLDEFRSRNVELAKKTEELEALNKKFEGIDPEKWPSLVELSKRVETKDLIDKQGFEKTLEERTKAMRADAEAQIKALSSKNSELEALARNATLKYHRSMIDRTITDAALKAGVREEAIPDIQLRAGALWSLNDREELVAMRDGATVYGKDGSKVLTVDEWMEDLRESATHLFKTSSGGGAGGGGGGGSGKVTSRSQLKTVAEKAAFIGKNGLEAFEALPD